MRHLLDSVGRFFRGRVRPDAGPHAEAEHAPARGFASRVSLRPYLDGPNLRDAPAEILAALRAVDPTCELHYFGLGVWAFGFYRWNREVVHEAQLRLHEHRKLPDEVQKKAPGRYWMHYLVSQGFRTFGGPDEYPGLHDESDIMSGKIVREFRFADWNYRNCREAAFRKNLKGSLLETGLERRIKILQDMHQATYRDSYRYAFNHQHSVMANPTGRKVS